MSVAKQKRLPWLAAGVCGLVVLIAAASPPRVGEGVDLSSSRSLPVVERGRIKPVDTAVRTALRTITGKESLIDDIVENDERKLNAHQWYLEIAGAPKLEDSR